MYLTHCQKMQKAYVISHILFKIQSILQINRSITFWGLYITSELWYYFWVWSYYFWLWVKINWRSNIIPVLAYVIYTHSTVVILSINTPVIFIQNIFVICISIYFVSILHLSVFVVSPYFAARCQIKRDHVTHCVLF